MAHTLNNGISPYEIVFTNRFAEVNFATGLQAIQQVDTTVSQLAAKAADSVPLEGEIAFDGASNPWQELQTAAEPFAWSGVRVGCFVARALIKQEGRADG